MEKDSADAQKNFRLKREAELADSAYRSAIVELEDIRINLEQVQQKASTIWEGIEHQRCDFLFGSFKLLSTSLDDSNTRLRENICEFVEKSKNISFEEDCKLAADYFLLACPEREPIFFEHYKHRESVKSTLIHHLIFRFDFWGPIRLCH